MKYRTERNKILLALLIVILISNTAEVSAKSVTVKSTVANSQEKIIENYKENKNKPNEELYRKEKPEPIELESPWKNKILINKNMLTQLPKGNDSVQRIKIYPKITVESTLKGKFFSYTERLAENLNYQKLFNVFMIKPKNSNEKIRNMWIEEIEKAVSALNEFEYINIRNKNLKYSDERIVKEVINTIEFIIPEETSNRIGGYTVTDLETGKSEIVLLNDFSLIPDDDYIKSKMSDIIYHELGHVLWNKAEFFGIDVAELYSQGINGFTRTDFEDVTKDWETNLEEDFAENFRIYAQKFVEEKFWTEKGKITEDKLTTLDTKDDFEYDIFKILNTISINN